MIKFLFALALVVGQPVLAQTNAELLARIEKLERALGPYADSIPPATLAEIPLRCPELPNQRYSVFCRIQQIGLGIDQNNEAVNGLIPRVMGMQIWQSGHSARLSVVEQLTGAQPGGIINANKIILGQCEKSDQAAQLSICGQQDASVYLESNGAGTQHQSGSRHYGMFSMSADRGIRTLLNQYVSTECVPAMDNDANPPVAYMDCVKTFIEPNAPVGLFGPDSQAQFSIKMCYPNKPCPRPQVAIFKMYQDANEAGWELHWPGMRWLLVTDGKYGPAKFYKPPLQ